MPLWLFVLMQLAAVACALVGGVFLAFSDFIMRALERTGGSGGIEAMQVINREVFRWLFMTLFLGLVPISLFLVFYAVFSPAPLAGALGALAGLVYLVGCFGVTVAGNVPMNEKLAKLAPEAAATRSYWTTAYLSGWTRWNTVRAMACVAAALLLLTAAASTPPAPLAG